MVLSVLLGMGVGICLGLLSVGVRELLLGNLAQSAEAFVVSVFAGVVGSFLFSLERDQVSSRKELGK